MLKVIMSDSKKLTEKLQQEKNVVFSKKQSAFLLDSETYDILNQKYYFESYLEDSEVEIVDFDGFVYLPSFEEFIRDAFEGMEDIRIQMPYFTDSEEVAVIDLGEHYEMITDLYDEECLDESARENIQELMSSEDWYVTLLKDAKEFLLDLWLDDVKATVNQMQEKLAK